MNRATLGVRCHRMKKYIPIYLMLLPGAVYLLINNYIPMAGIVMAFKNLNFSKGIWGSDWVGLKNFEYLFKTPEAFNMTRNTILYNLVFIALTMILSVFVAILLSEVRRKISMKVYQTVLLLPYMISMVIVSYLGYAFMAEDGGLLNRMLETMGKDSISWYNAPQYWPVILTVIQLWKNVGYQSIIFLAAVMGIDQEMYEAARIDGAGRWKLMWHITLPAIKGTVVMMLILRVGGLLNTGYEQIFLMRNDLNMEMADVFDTYIFTRGITNGQYSFSTAAGIFKSVVGIVMVLSSDWFAKKMGESGLY